MRWGGATVDATTDATTDAATDATADATTGATVDATTDATTGATRSPTGPGGAGAAARDRRGERLGRYVVVDLLGQGGMSTVYKAFDPELDRLVALKLVSGGGEEGHVGRERLLREARALAKLAHPNVVAVHDVGVLDGQVFLALEYVEGRTLRAWLGEAPRRPAEVLDVYAEVGRGLSAAHEAGLVHRDVKPDNVIVSADGRVRVLDFGLVRWDGRADDLGPPAARESAPRGASPASERPAPARPCWSSSPPPPDAGAAPAAGELTSYGEAVGTLRYIAPEQFLGEAVDARCDQFSFCVALYEALYGEHPFPGATLDERLESMLHGRLRPPPARSRAPAAVGRVLARGLSDDPNRRWPSMAALLDALARARRPPLWRNARVAAPVVPALAVAAALAARAAGRADPCGGAGARVGGAWGEGRRAEVRRAFLASGRPYAAESLRTVEAQLDRYAGAWAQMRVEACEATRVRGEQSEELFDLRVRCLDTRLAGLASLAEGLAAADADAVERAVEAASGLEPLAACADAEALRAPLRPPDDPAARRRVQSARDELERAGTLRRIGRYDESLRRSDAVLADARALGYGPLVAEALVASAETRLELGRYDEAGRGLRAAWLEAETARHDDVRLAAWEGQAWLESVVAGRPDASLAWAELGRAVLASRPGYERRRRGVDLRLMIALARLGRFAEALPVAEAFARRHAPGATDSIDDVAQMVKELHGASYVFRLGGDVDRALALARREYELAVAHFGREHRAATGGRTGLTYALALADRCHEALAYAQEAHAALDAGEARASIQAFMATQNLGEMLLWLDRPLEAKPYLERAAAEARARFGPHHIDVLYPSVLLARAYAGAGLDALAREAFGRLRPAADLVSSAPADDDERYVFALFAHDLAAAGFLDEAERVLARLEAVDPAPPGPAGADVLVARARLEAERGRPDAAAAAVERARALYGPGRNLPRRRVDEAHALYALARAFARLDPPRARALTLEARRLLERADCSDPALRRALDGALAAPPPP
ncbi:MAG TPA: serine/threonine-protein kinase [Polyangiaceae bacterium]|nr:serine/threonine-protein kinase [Polyangiaceae bacterium]